MPLSWNEIRDRSVAFARDWKHAESEDADAKSFWDAFFDVFGVPRRRVASFERRVKKVDGRDGYIDLLWKGTLLVQHKSRGRDLERAHQQALEYFPGLKDRDLPRYLLVSDFARFRLYDLEAGKDAPPYTEFRLADLPKRIKHFAFIAGYTPQTMPPALLKAHQTLDAAVDATYGKRAFKSDAERVAFLFELYQKFTSLLPAAKAAAVRRGRERRG